MKKNLVERYLRALELTGDRQNTLSQYRSILKKMYGEFEIGDNNEVSKLKNISSNDLEDFIEKMIEDNYAASTINLTLITMKSYFNYLIDKDIRTSNPTKALPKKINEDVCNVETKVKEILTLEEIHKLINATYVRVKGERKFELSSARMRFVLSLGFTTGMRIQEILSLTDDEITPMIGEKGYWINIGKNKIKNKIDKRLPIVGMSFRYYMEYLEERSKLDNKENFVILSNNGKHIATKDFNEALEKLVVKAGIDKHITSHCSRHSMVNIARDKGYSDEVIKEVGGWKKSGIMESVYSRNSSYDKIKIEFVQNILTVAS